jgi:hypothetical protein
MRRCVTTPTGSTARVRNRRKHRNVAAEAPQLALSRRSIPVPKHGDSAPWLQRFAISRAQVFQKRLALSGEPLLKNRRFAKTPYNDITPYGAIRSVSVSV